MRVLREEAGLTRARLAQLAGVPIASVRRMEWRRVARFDHALKVAQALGKPPETVFAPAFQILESRGVKSDREFDDLARNDHVFRRELHDVGIDPHPRAWTLKVHFLGGESRVWPISSGDLDRFWHYVEKAEHSKAEERFFAFSGDVVSVVFSLAQMAHAHALVDAVTPTEADEDDVPGIEVLLAGGREWLSFDADFDEPDHEDIAAYQGQLNELIGDLEQAEYGDPYVWFDDEDKERAVFRVSALAAVAISQQLRWGCDDGYAKEPEDQPLPPPRKRRSALKVVPSR